MAINIRTLSRAWLAPRRAGDYDPEVSLLLEQLKHPKSSHSEIGLDYWIDGTKMSKKGFRRQIQLSRDLDLPLFATMLEDTMPSSE